MSGLLTGWDLLISDNAAAHKTRDFNPNELVLRRGQSFNVSCTLSRDLQPGEILSFVIEIGSPRSQSKETRIVMPISSSGSKTLWSATSVSHIGSTMITSINIPATAIIGCYQLSLQASSGGRSSTRSFGDFYVLFNPWAEDDEVYMENESDRSEYVLNETGVIFTGTFYSIARKTWDYGQFEDDILDTTLAMLDKSRDAERHPVSDLLKRNSAIHVARVLSAMVNSNNEGVLKGKWSGDYSKGVNPSSWNGSVPILRSWHQKGPVSYGQCWVFAGVLCTVLRCLGIPSRVITNFDSAHDTDMDLLIDFDFDSKGKKLDKKHDSIWNFHAWNEGWMKRGDLGSFYSGWQILDATPQELSKGLYRLGPCSLKAVHEGDVDLDYDTHFVFAEVNGDVVHWIKYKDGSPSTKVYSNCKEVGKLTSTKAVGSMHRADVTLDYKYAEGTAEERQIFEKARLKMLTSATSALNPSGPARGDAPCPENLEQAPKPDFTGIFKLPGQPQVGEDLCFILHLKNDAAEAKDVKANMTATAIIYTGATVKAISAKEQTVSLGPNEEKQMSFTVTYLEYKDAITTDNMVQVVAVCVDDNGKRLLTKTVGMLKNPTLHLKVSGNPVLNQPLTVDVVFLNPLDEDVANGHVVMAGSGLLRNPLSMPVPHVKPNETSTTQFEFTPYKAGQRLLLVNFSSDQFPNADAHELITISSA